MNLDLDSDHIGHDVVERPSKSIEGILGCDPYGYGETIVTYCRDCNEVIE